MLSFEKYAQLVANKKVAFCSMHVCFIVFDDMIILSACEREKRTQKESNSYEYYYYYFTATVT